MAIVMGRVMTKRPFFDSYITPSVISGLTFHRLSPNYAHAIEGNE